MKKKVHRNDRKKLPWDFEKCPGSLYFPLLTGDKLDSNLGYEPIERVNLLKRKGEKFRKEKRKFG